MADINTPSDVSPGESISGIGDWFTVEETRNFAFLIMMCQAFQEKVMAYYRADANPANRLRRLNNIRTALKGISFTESGQTFTIAPTSGGGCWGNEKPVDGVCMNTRG